MREIKLRAWDIEANDWAYGTLNIKRFRFDIKCDIYGQLVEGYGIDGLIKEETMSEYTGYKDINDVEIYEGDIVKKEFMEQWLENTTLIGVVTMVEGCWYVLDEENKKIEPLWSETDINTVIGNIYENKELLEVE
jgi:uncharacterized phage protein (TIGR01671 family)